MTGLVRQAAFWAAMGGVSGLVALIIVMALTTPVRAATAQDAADDGSSLREAAALAVHWGDFDEVQRLFHAMRERNRRTGTGQPESTPFRIGLEAGLQPSSGLRVRQAEQTVAMTQLWTQQHPQSPLAHFLYMTALTDLAWAYRGSGFSQTVPPQAWAPFTATLERAADHADEHEAVLLSDSLGYRVLFSVARGLGWGEGRIKRIYTQAADRFPDDDSLHFAQLTNVLPKWRGNAMWVDQHIASVVKRTRDSHGLAMYAWLYTAAAEEQYQQALFLGSLARWDRMDQGFQDLTDRYPHPQHFNAWAWMACQAEDRQRLLDLLDKVGPEPDLTKWGSNPRQTFETCRDWARRT